MKRAIFVLSAVCVIGLMSGCAGGKCGGVHGSCYRAPENCVSSTATCPTEACAGEGVQQCGFFERIKGRCGNECGDCGCECGRPHCLGHCGGRCAGRTCTGPLPYPYYTLRGPRDFLAPCPPSIGP